MLRKVIWTGVGLGLVLAGCDGRTADPVDAAPGTDAGDAAVRRQDATTPSCEPELVFPPESLPSCTVCGAGRCVSRDLVEESDAVELLDCSSSHVCVPDEYLLTNGEFTPASCEAAFGAEGRCLSTCLISVDEILDILPISSCPPSHRCVACFDPFDGSSTGACEVGCDEGPTESPVVLPSCCEGRGVCVPTESVPANGRPFYDSCERDANSLCIPRPIVGRTDYVAPSCTATALAATYGEEYGPGVCAHICQAGIEALSPWLSQEDCADEFLCVSCLDPVDGEPTGACDE